MLKFLFFFVRLNPPPHTKFLAAPLAWRTQVINIWPRSVFGETTVFANVPIIWTCFLFIEPHNKTSFYLFISCTLCQITHNNYLSPFVLFLVHKSCIVNNKVKLKFVSIRIVYSVNPCNMQKDIVLCIRFNVISRYTYEL